MQKETYTISEFIAAGPVGRTKTYEEAREGRLKIQKIGNKSFITAEERKRWLASLPTLEGSNEA